MTTQLLLLVGFSSQKGFLDMAEGVALLSGMTLHQLHKVLHFMGHQAHVFQGEWCFCFTVVPCDGRNMLSRKCYVTIIFYLLVQFYKVVLPL